jgi:hypothetical protein
MFLFEVRPWIAMGRFLYLRKSWHCSLEVCCAVYSVEIMV